MGRETNTHIFFWDGEFSNWYPCKFRHKGITFFNSEQAFMWEKAVFFNDMEMAKKIVINTDPAACKFLGRKVKGFKADVWLKIGYNVMVEVNYEKYNQDTHLNFLLRQSHPKIIVEASPEDRIWGIGLHYNDDRVLDMNNWKGRNLLGIALMEVRERLIKEHGEILE
jgi:ribA/ribD-fused uncharacterized protein